MRSCVLQRKSVKARPHTISARQERECNKGKFLESKPEMSLRSSSEIEKRIKEDCILSRRFSSILQHRNIHRGMPRTYPLIAVLPVWPYLPRTRLRFGNFSKQTCCFEGYSVSLLLPPLVPIYTTKEDSIIIHQPDKPLLLLDALFIVLYHFPIDIVVLHKLQPFSVWNRHWYSLY